MTFRYPLPTASPFDDIEQYVPLLLTAVEAELNIPSVWPDGESNTGEGYAEDLIAWIMELTNTTTMSVPIGGIIPFAGASAPSGWFLCDGQALSTTTYAALYDLIGTTYGAGDGGTFKVPDLRGKAPIGAGQGLTLTNRVLASVFGAETHQLDVSEMPAHNHTQAAHNHGVTDLGHSHGVTDSGHSHSANNPAHSHGVTDSGHSHGVTDSGHTHTIPGRSATTDGTGVPRLANSATSTTTNTTSSATTGVSVNSATTGVSVNNATTNVSVNSATTNVSVNSATTGVSVNNATPTINNTGGGSAHNNMQPSIVLNFIIRAS